MVVALFGFGMCLGGLVYNTEMVIESFKKLKELEAQREGVY